METTMTTEDLQRLSAATVEQSTDALYQQLALLGAYGAGRWAHVQVSAMLNVLLLWPRDRGPVEHQEVPYRVTQRTAERGVWKVTLCREVDLPAGVPLSTRDAVLRAQISRSVMHVDGNVADQVVQCGLFGEVLYR
jgi:hypothetical protein